MVVRMMRMRTRGDFFFVVSFEEMTLEAKIDSVAGGVSSVEDGGVSEAGGVSWSGVLGFSGGVWSGDSDGVSGGVMVGSSLVRTSSNTDMSWSRVSMD